MTEAFLHYVWQYQYFHKHNLITTGGEEITIFQTGTRNSNAGPDFSEAKIRIGNLEWRGSVEIHLKSSGWTDHRHQHDQAYERVILHVVWEDDKPVQHSDGTTIPTLELKTRVAESLWNKYRSLIVTSHKIPCADSLPSVKRITMLSMLDQSGIQRMESKAGGIMQLIDSTQGDWEEGCYRALGKNFGFKVNTDPFYHLTTAIPYKILLKHRDNLLQIEALLFGVSGLLEPAGDDDYVIMLKREYEVLRKKYNLTAKQLIPAQWKFLRLRPSNFPTIRIAQWAALLHTRQNLFSAILESETPSKLLSMFKVAQSSYWKNHFVFNKPVKNVPSLGESSLCNIMINTVAPLLVAYGKHHDDQRFIDRAEALLNYLASESNTIVTMWKSLGIKAKSAFDSQALLEQYNNYCQRKRCLECVIGCSLIK